MANDPELERAVLRVLWDHPEGMVARDILAALADRELARTTVLTVLDRLRRKELVTRDDDRRPHRYFASTSHEEFIAQTMLDALEQAPDRDAALTQFLGGVTDTDTDHLRGILRRRRRRPPTGD